MLNHIDQAQLAQVFSQEFSTDLPGEDCPSAEELWMACTLELDLEARQKIIDHCIVCPHCAQEMRITREMVSEHNELMVGAPANSVNIQVPALSLAEMGQAAQLRIVPDASAEPANDQAQTAQSKVVSLGSWRSKLNKVTAGSGVLAVAAALAFIVVKKGGADPESSGGAWRGQDSQGQGENHRFSQNTFSWPAQADVEHYELEIKSAKGSKFKCVQTVPTNQLTFDPSHCPELSISQPFFWRVRAVTKQGQGEFSRYFAAKGL